MLDADKKLIREWVKSVGGLSKATMLITEDLECSISKAEKIATARYPSPLSFSEKKSLSDLMGMKVELIFPGKKNKAS